MVGNQSERYFQQICYLSHSELQDIIEDEYPKFEYISCPSMERINHTYGSSGCRNLEQAAPPTNMGNILANNLNSLYQNIENPNQFYYISPSNHHVPYHINQYQDSQADNGIDYTSQHQISQNYSLIQSGYVMNQMELQNFYHQHIQQHALQQNVSSQPNDQYNYERQEGAPEYIGNNIVNSNYIINPTIYNCPHLYRSNGTKTNMVDCNEPYHKASNSDAFDTHTSHIGAQASTVQPNVATTSLLVTPNYPTLFQIKEVCTR
ncbi:hypothetical protein RF11_10542 [Thelohanellus kitauei]|uniref:Uncharacterized protein n=1 Tax=Thelohanellus kitauei TaxID=669202 RepID=A0A0C2J4K5_THEKT|nr:hypothetical protein RF11_10542 [Thelohanellus kitauei]